MKNLLIQKPYLSLFILLVVVFVVWVLINTYMRATSPTTEKTMAPGLETAYFAGGCFWCVESDFEKFAGIKEVISGYMGGATKNPSYQNHADHREAVEVRYDPTVISYQDLVEYFFRHHDPTDEGGSFYDRGHSYTSAIYPQNDQEEQTAWQVIKQLTDDNVFPKPIVTAVEQDATFWTAEDYHQDYYKKNSLRYKAYRKGSGRDKYINSVWGERDDFEVIPDGLADNPWVGYEKPSDRELQSTLDPLVYKVTQKEGTERPFTPGNLDDEKRDGIFVDVLSGEPLYSSKDKFDSGTGWPSFSKPISDEFIVTKTDRKLLIARTEVRSKYGDNHLGHVFNDGPQFNADGTASTGQRWCMNGAAMRFIPVEEMEAAGYSDYIQFVN